MADNNPTSLGGDTASQTPSATKTTAPAPGISPTDPSPLALTTPFVPPPGCDSIWASTTVATSANGTLLTVTVLASNVADARFTSCQPSGWAANIPAQAFSFSPAVCPSGWTYWGMEETMKLADNSPAYSTAFCCDRGYSPAPSWYALPALTAPCIRSFGANEGILSIATAGAESTSPGNNQPQPHTTTAPIPSGVLMHEGWHISWRATDTSTLTPSLPALNSGQSYSTWVPGQTGEPEWTRGEVSGDGPKLDGLAKFVSIGVPIIVVVFVVAVGGCCFAAWRNKTKRGPTAPVLDSVRRENWKGPGV